MKTINVESMSLEGRVDWDGEIIIYVTTGRLLRSGRYEEIRYRCSVDVFVASCVRRTLAKLSRESIGKRRTGLDAEERTLAES